MESSAELLLLLLGSFLLVGYVAHVLGNRTHLPRVVLLILVGIVAGPAGLNLIPESASTWFPTVSQAALSVIGFTLGEKFLGSRIRLYGKRLLILSICKVFGTALVVFLVLMLFQVPVIIALVLAGISTATDPASTIDVIGESRAQGELTDTTLRLVAVDDAWGVMLFSLLMAIALSLSGNGDSWSLLLAGVREIGGVVVLGIVLGLPMAAITGRVSEGELTLIEALGFIFICSGVAVLLDLSYILACMTMGCVVTNVASHHIRPFHAIENIREPFLIIFFLLAGYHADLMALLSMGALSVLYVLSRIVGKLGACWIGAELGGYSPRVRNHIGWCTLPQAGVALGLALLASSNFPDYAEQIMAVAIGTSVVFQIVGPLVTRRALSHAGEVGEA